jgi:hypothetical protein
MILTLAARRGEPKDAYHQGPLIAEIGPVSIFPLDSLDTSSILGL